MNWNEQCVFALRERKLFEDSWHLTRFKELLDCYAGYAFFTKGLCKCMYLSAWDEEHFCIMLEMLMCMSLGQETSVGDMRINGDRMAENQKDAQVHIYYLSNAFLDNEPFHLDENADIPADIRYIIERALLASQAIDELPEPPQPL